MTENTLEKRMYFLVMYNLSDIQKGIQAGHAAIEYSNKYGSNKEYKNWALEHKTFIILNGGTSNDGLVSCFGEPVQTGTMQDHVEALRDNDIDFAIFREPDANAALTALAFIVDERVFNHKDYPTFINYMKPTMNFQKFIKIANLELTELKELFPAQYNEWEELIGGKHNVFLKYFLPQFKLA